MVEWSRALDVRLSEWCCSVSMVWVQIRRGKNKNLTDLKSNSNTVWFNFQTYIYIYYSKIDNSVSSPQLGYHCLFVNILLYVIVFGYVCLLNCLYIFIF